VFVWFSRLVGFSVVVCFGFRVFFRLCGGLGWWFLFVWWVVVCEAFLYVGFGVCLGGLCECG